MFVHGTGKRLPSVLLFGLYLTLFCNAGHAGETVYRCPDAQGHIQFQQHPCSGDAGEEIYVEAESKIWAPVPNAREIISEGSARQNKPRKKGSTRRGKSSGSDKSCWKAEQKIERIQWKLRKGYKPAEGERMRQQRRELEEYLRRFCG